MAQLRMMPKMMAMKRMMKMRSSEGSSNILVPNVAPEQDWQPATNFVTTPLFPNFYSPVSGRNPKISREKKLKKSGKIDTSGQTSL